MTAKAVNNHDNVLFPESFEKLMATVEWLCLDLSNSYLTLDSGFDSQNNKVLISYQNLTPVIKPNTRNCGQEKRYALLDEFEPFKPTYNQRVKIERDFAWKGKYRKLVIRYEKLQCTFMGFRYLAYTMINYRSILGKNN